MTALEANVRSVQERMAAASRRVQRDPAETTLVVVTKTRTTAAIQAAYDLGLRQFGENRVEEAETTVQGLPEDITWHMIGHIQGRKASRVVPLFDIIHSVDGAKLARSLDRLCVDRAEPLPLLLECNVSGEVSKYGFQAHRWADDHEQWASLLAAVGEIVALPNLRIQGLMTMAPIVADPEQARPIFHRLRRLRDALAAAFPRADWHHLSMGMSDDFEVAIEEGATYVRVGRAIFDPGLPSWHED
jgi:pyridoxal phosphate enzyme (YggS family)